MQERQQLISQLHSSLRSGPDGRPLLDFASLAEPGPSEGAPINISGLDTFTLDYKVTSRGEAYSLTLKRFPSAKGNTAGTQLPTDSSVQAPGSHVAKEHCVAYWFD